ncbi:CPCC family cysteine-rich protein [Herbidospora sp. RD11066]
MKPFPCSCCGHLTQENGPGSWEICSVCFWEDDITQLRWPLLDEGANRVSLVEAQKNFALFAASERKSLPHVRPPRPSERVAAGWRVIDLAIDRFEPTDRQLHPWPSDYTVLYWWSPGFWHPMARDETKIMRKKSRLDDMCSDLMLQDLASAIEHLRATHHSRAESIWVVSRVFGISQAEAKERIMSLPRSQ